MKTYKYEVVHARFGNVLGYVRAADITHAWAQAAARYRVPIVVLGEYSTRPRTRV